eukprot:CAMPEP_0171141656 /NCGR_PEP_ID=MMETSP0766_2-20121228/140982_1 /TAXON_ID=439317 /ORGANISM="Gambierdiscus australes, Strain CAWD 149" /LENGTH=261 /DNA_ID=CAMNT_0011605389 /DNA_START=478 /DNA_END=1260 /DNA_ORIENTATION=+
MAPVDEEAGTASCCHAPEVDAPHVKRQAEHRCRGRAPTMANPQYKILLSQRACGQLLPARCLVPKACTANPSTISAVPTRGARSDGHVLKGDGEAHVPRHRRHTLVTARSGERGSNALGRVSIPFLAAASIAAAAPIAVTSPATTGPAILAQVWCHSLGPREHAFMMASDSVQRAPAFDGIRVPTAAAASALATAPSTVPGLLAMGPAMFAGVAHRRLAGAQVLAGVVQQPDLVDEHLAPACPSRARLLLVAKLDVHSLLR